MGRPTASQAHRWGKPQAHMCIPTCGGPQMGIWGGGDMWAAKPRSEALFRWRWGAPRWELI